MFGKVVCFLCRILALPRSLQHNHHHTNLSKEFHWDIQWWLCFLRPYNGVSVIPSVRMGFSPQTHALMAVVDLQIAHSILAVCRTCFWLPVCVPFWEFELRAIHLAGSDNRLADFLSRWHLVPQYQELFFSPSGSSNMREI